MRPDDLERAARIVVACSYDIHRELGPGLLESAYEALLAEVVRQAGLSVERQVSVAMSYKRVVVDNAFKIDLKVEKSLVRLPLGLLINFGQATFKDGLRRVANDYYGRIG